MVGVIFGLILFALLNAAKISDQDNQRNKNPFKIS